MTSPRVRVALVESGVAGAEVTRNPSDAEPRLHLTVRAADAIAERMIALENECAALRTALKSAESQRDEATKHALAMTRAILRTHETYNLAIASLQEQINSVALAASLVPSLEQKIKEVGALADRLAQEQTVRNLRSPEDNESCADAVDAARAER